MLGCASDLGAVRARHTSTKQLAALTAAAEPALYLPRMARDGRAKHAFSRRLLQHGMFRDSSLDACSDQQRRLEVQQQRRSQQIAALTADFDKETRRLLRLQGKLDRRQRVRATTMATNAAAALIQRKLRVFLAECELRWLKRRFAARLIVNVLRYRHWLRRARTASTKIQSFVKTSILRHKWKLARRSIRASTAVQRVWRGERCRATLRHKWTIIATTNNTVNTIMLFGFTRAHQCLMGPHTAASSIQVRYRRRLRRRRATERRARRMRPGGASKLSSAFKRIGDTVDKDKPHTFKMPSRDALHRFIHKRAAISTENVSQLLQAAKFMATQAHVPYYIRKHKGAAMLAQIPEHAVGLTTTGRLADEGDHTFITTATRQRPSRPTDRPRRSQRSGSNNNNSRGHRQLTLPGASSRLQPPVHGGDGT